MHFFAEHPHVLHIHNNTENRICQLLAASLAKSWRRRHSGYEMQAFHTSVPSLQFMLQ